MDQRDFNPLYYAAQPVRMARRGGGRGLLGDLGEVLWLTAPIWGPILIVQDLYENNHPVLATFYLILWIIAGVASYLAYRKVSDWWRNLGPADSTQHDHITTVDQVMEAAYPVAVESQTTGKFKTQLEEILAAPYPAEALRETVAKNMSTFSFPKGSEEYDDEMLWNQHELAKNVKRAMIDEWHETRKIHGIGHQTECIEEREDAVDKVTDELFSYLWA